MAATHGLGVMPWSPLAGGFLSGKYKRHREMPKEGRFTVRQAQRGDDPAVLRSEQAYDIVEGIENLASEKNCTASQLALAWCMQQPHVTAPIIGPRHMDQLEDNLKALEVTLTEGDHLTIDRMIPPGTYAVPFYEARFGPHPHRWL
jgi:aryl-alcohol dehydrogenase-like predicted oxidoreductase